MKLNKFSALLATVALGGALMVSACTDDIIDALTPTCAICDGFATVCEGVNGATEADVDAAVAAGNSSTPGSCVKE
jgi:hypothetical protein